MAMSNNKMTNNQYEYLLAEVELLNDKVEELESEIAFLKDKLLEK